MRRMFCTLTLLLSVSGGGALLAQETAQPVSQGASSSAAEAEVARIAFLAANVEVDATPGDETVNFEPAHLDMGIPEGSIIRTGKNAFCEVAMPDGSLLRISSGSVFKVDTVAKNRETGSRAQRFTLIFGKLKAKVTKLASADSSFEVVSGTALAGVRGTVFGVSYDGEQSQVLVFEGSLNLKSTTVYSKPVVLRARRMGIVSAEDAPGRAKRIPKAMIAQWEKELGDFGSTAAIEEPTKGEEGVRGEKSTRSSFLALGAHVGTVTIDHEVYAQWAFEPELTFGKVGMKFYLPAVFKPGTGFFEFDQWQNYWEWDFSGGSDTLNDILVKISSLSYGKPGDQVYGRLGGLGDFTFGHGFIVDGYTNMLAFPEARKVGLQFEAGGKILGFGSLVGDFSRFELIGGRFSVRPFGAGVPFAFGLSAVHDRPKPGSDLWPLIGGTTSTDELPRILVFGADTEVPLLDRESSKMKFYADAGKLAYAYPEVPATLSGYGVSAGALEFVKGVGAGFGVMGDVVDRFTYRAEYRYVHNYYEPGLFDALWDNTRLLFPKDLQAVIVEQNTAGFDDTNTSGILLRGGVTFVKILEIGLGYEGYTSSGDAEPKAKGSMYVDLQEGLIPKFSGRASYFRKGGLDRVLEEPFDEGTIFVAAASYALVPGASLSAGYNRSFVLNGDTGVSEPVNSFGLSAVIRFF
jgi:hypothetical protein